jgi:isopenicillin N synthase-like dioxygenase
MSCAAICHSSCHMPCCASALLHHAAQEFHQQYQHSSGSSTTGSTPGSTPGSTVEPSALQGILSERFCCGPDLTPEQQQDPYYSSDLGHVFFPPNCWPTGTVPQLQPQMLRCYSKCEVIAASLMQLLAAALGVPQHYFDDKLLRHHSNMQVRAASGLKRLDLAPRPR